MGELQAKQSSILHERMQELEEQLAQTCVMREVQTKQHVTLQGQILRLEEQLTTALSAKEDHIRQLGASHVQILALEQQLKDAYDVREQIMPVDVGIDFALSKQSDAMPKVELCKKREDLCAAKADLHRLQQAVAGLEAELLE